jgi:hypothetical protein
MELTIETIEAILRENWECSTALDAFPTDTVWFDFLMKPEDGVKQIDVNIVIEGQGWETILPLTIDITSYDEKFSDVNKFELGDMGLKIDIIAVNPGEEISEELTQENIWKVLFYNKVPEKYSR